jgi:threonine/homoserine/homoserine lactone efflux protein
MLNAAALWGFAQISLGMVLTPEPNMMYLVSRAICQGIGFLAFRVATDRAK